LGSWGTLEVGLDGHGKRKTVIVIGRRELEEWHCRRRVVECEDMFDQLRCWRYNGRLESGMQGQRVLFADRCSSTVAEDERLKVKEQWNNGTTQRTRLPACLEADTTSIPGVNKF